MPKVIDYDAKKQQIIETARDVFAERGYRNTNLLHISKSCGMGRTTLYQYFANKDEIFYYTIALTMEEIKSQIKTIINNNQLTFTERLKQTIHQLAKEQNHNRAFILMLEAWLILRGENNETLEGLREHLRELKLIIEGLVEEAIIAGEIKPIDSRSLTETIYTVIETFALQRTSNQSNVEVKIESLNLLIDGLKTELKGETVNG